MNFLTRELKARDEAILRQKMRKEKSIKMNKRMMKDFDLRAKAIRNLCQAIPSMTKKELKSAKKIISQAQKENRAAQKNWAENRRIFEQMCFSHNLIINFSTFAALDLDYYLLEIANAKIDSKLFGIHINIR